MLKKSLLLSIAVLLTAVIFIFTGCEGPTGAPGQDAANGDINFPGDITVSVPGSGNTAVPPSLPPGVTYPDANGAKILAGNAADISKAFNGGVFVANTPDSGDPYDSANGATNDGTVYGQDGVDAVVWTGIVTGGDQGSIVVPPGKTLFIAAPLPMGFTGGVADFQGITIADKATYFAQANPSIQAAINGGTTVDGNTPEGKVVILNGGSIVGDGATTEPITIGGYLEIHRGGFIDVGAATLYATAGSTINNYGRIEGSNTALTFNGELTVKGGGEVIGSDYDDVFNGKITVESYGRFNVVGSGAPLDFYKPVEVQANAEFNLTASDVIFHDVTTMAGTLNADVYDVSVLSTGHLKITATGKIEVWAWSQFKGVTNTIPKNGDVWTLLESIKPSAQPLYANNYTTIEVPTDGTLVSFTFNAALNVETYENLRNLAASEVLYLGKGVSLAYNGIDAKTYFTTESSDLEIKTNDVVLTVFTEIGNVTIDAGRSLGINSAVDTAGAIKVYGEFAAPDATFAAKLDELTIGPELFDAAVDPVRVALPKAIFTNASPAITVNPGARLTLGDASNPVINPAGSIKLAGQDSNLVITGSGATLARLDSLEIAAGAEFTSAAASGLTFAALEKLTVNGFLSVTVGANPFTKLQKDVSQNGNNDVGGSGKAVFRSLNITASLNHAFDQLLGIRDLTVNSVNGISATAGGTANGETQDASPPQGGNGPITLTVLNGITVPTFTDPLKPGYPGRLIIDRDLVVFNNGTVNFGAPNQTLSIKTGFKIYVGDDDLNSTRANKPILSSGAGDYAVLVGAGATALQAHYTNGDLTAATANFRVQRGSNLNVEGKLITGAASGQLLAGGGTAQINLQTTTLEKVNVISKTDDEANFTGEIAVTSTGTLTVAGAGAVPTGSIVTIATGGKIISTSTLTFGSNSATSTLVDSGPSIGIGTIVGGSGAVTITGGTNASATPAEQYATATITGDVIGADGATVLQGTGDKGQKLIINGTVNLRNTGTSYDSIILAQVDISNEFAFNVTADTVSLLGTGTLVGRAPSNNTNLNLTTKDNSLLNIGGLGTLKATGGQNLNGVTLDGTGGLTGGVLTLASGSVLAVPAGQNFDIGNGDESSPELRVGTGIITLANNTSSITVAAIDTLQYGTLIIGSYSIEGQASAFDLDDYAEGEDIDDSVTIYDIWYESDGVGSTTDSPAAQGVAGTLDINAGAISVVGNAASTIITSDTKLFRYEP
jgi:hypothetical protein